MSAVLSDNDLLPGAINNREDRKSFLLLVLVMVVACVMVMVVMTLVFYRGNIQTQRNMLQMAAQGQARLMAAVARHDNEQSTILRKVVPEYDAARATLRQIIAAHENFKGFGETGETMLAQSEGNAIIFISRQQQNSNSDSVSVTMDSGLAEPMKLALGGERGVVVGIDYRGKEVLAAYEPILELKLGIVVKVDMAELRAPFIRYGFIGSLFAFVIVLIGAVFFVRISRPIIKRMESHTQALEKEVAERKLAEFELKKQQALLDETGKMAKVGGWYLDIGAQKLTWTAEVHRIHEVGAGYVPLLESALDFYTPESKPKLTEAIERAIEYSEPFDLELVIKTSEGNLRWVHAMGHANTTGGVIKGLIGTFQDITYKKRVEKEKQQLEAHLQQAYKMEAIGTLAGGIAHDFNNLLSIISGNIAIIERKLITGSNPDKNIQHSKDAVHRATNLVKQILSFSRQDKHKLVPINLSIAIEDSLNLLRSTIPATIKIISTVDSGTTSINADSVQLQQVIINLCTNAVQAMKEKGLLAVNLVEEELAVEEILPAAVRQAGKYAKLSVIDTGSGMDKQTMSKIFEPFYTTKDVGKGTGMGLAMVHGIVEQHGGFVTVDSTLDQGSTFNVYFPIIGEIEAEEPGATMALPVGTERILFVDDEKHIAATSAELLESRGYRVICASSSNQALEIFKSRVDELDLIITDQTMPEMTGVELATEILNIRPDIPIILCSGYSTTVSEADALRIGIREFCMKPLGMEQLFTITRRVLDERDHLSSRV